MLAPPMQIKSGKRETVNSSGRFKLSNTGASSRGRDRRLSSDTVTGIISRDRSTTAVTVSCVLSIFSGSPFGSFVPSNFRDQTLSNALSNATLRS